MLTISREAVDAIRGAERAEDLHKGIQDAITLELATIPPYFCAYCTIKPRTNTKVAQILKEIFIEEMLHMTIMGNLMIALEGQPAIAKAGAAITYPGKLPMNVGNSVEASLRKCSIAHISDVFMEIEKPEKPIEFPPFAARDYATIGEFYRALVAKLEALPGRVVTGDPAKQVITTYFNANHNFRIVDVATAKRAILDVIVLQGEGTEVSPEEAAGAFAHYYQFKQIVVGKELRRDGSGWSYSGADIVLKEADVWNMEKDPKAANYPVGSEARIAVDAFNAEYSALLRGLDEAFNGQPGMIDSLIDDMGPLTASAREVLAIPAAPGADTQAGPSFEYVP